MRLPILLMIIFLLLNGVVDYYLYKIIKKRCENKLWAKCQALFSIIVAIAIVGIICLPRRTGSDDTLYFIMYGLISYFSIYVPKYLFLLFDFISKIPQLYKHTPWKYVSKIGIVVAITTFLLMWWGVINRYNINEKYVDVEILSLPHSFDGYRIAQISDLHVGSYNKDTAFVSKLVDKLNSLDVDAVVFTGDIVNRTSLELLPFVSTLSRIKTKDGVFSILGNHDYGDYSDWESDEAKRANMQLMYDLQKKMNWRLLLNEYVSISRESDSIAIIGVENLGDPPFKNYGSLEKADTLIDKSVTKILLSHNPAHWERQIKDNTELNIPLTLSGHTHAMQVELFGISPAVFRYKYWGGLYSDSLQQKLYVNVGVGTVAMPMRIGATPEITILTLKAPK